MKKTVVSFAHKTMTYEYPKSIARFYDLIYHQVRDGVDDEFYQNEIKKTKGKILEVGVGTGRLFINSLNKGADIYGLDISQSMIDVLFSKLDRDKHKRISLQNIIDFHFDFKFDLIIAPFRVFMHLLEKDDQIKAINNVHRHLSANGKFIFDVFVPDLNLLLNGIHDQTDFEGEYAPGKMMRRIVSSTPDLISQVTKVDFRLEWNEYNELKHEDWEFPMRFFFRYELEHLVERSKFQKYKILGDYHGNELNKESRDFIVICQKSNK